MSEKLNLEEKIKELEQKRKELTTQIDELKEKRDHIEISIPFKEGDFVYYNRYGTEGFGIVKSTKIGRDGSTKSGKTGIVIIDGIEAGLTQNSSVHICMERVSLFKNMTLEEYNKKVAEVRRYQKIIEDHERKKNWNDERLRSIFSDMRFESTDYEILIKI